MGYELKEEFLQKYENGSYCGYDICHFSFNGHNYIVEINFRPDVDNGGYEFEMNYKTDIGYEDIRIQNPFRLYQQLTICYLDSLHRLMTKVNEIPHLKVLGFKEIDGNPILDSRKDRIALKYVEKVLNIEKVFVDLHNNTIIILDKNNYAK